MIPEESKNWEDLLFTWTSDVRKMCWLNTNGQQMVIDMRKDISSEVKALQNAAKSHFTNGTPLEVSDSIVDNRAAYSRIPIPSINIAFRNRYSQNYDPGSGYEQTLLCYVNAGPKSLTTEIPFLTVPVTSAGQEVVPNSTWPETVSAATVYWDVSQFEAQLNTWAASHWPPVTTSYTWFAQDALASPQWQVLKQRAQTQRIGFFWIFVNETYTLPRYSEPWMLNLKDATGDIVDTWNMNVSRNDLGIEALETSTNVNVTSAVASTPTNAVVGTQFDYVFGVTNTGPGGAYGVKVTFPVNPSFELRTFSATQGSGVFTNGQLTYLVGALANGSDAQFRLRLVSFRDGNQALGGPLNSDVGLALSNTSPNDSPSGTVSVLPPSLRSTRGLGAPKLSWTSDTSRLVLERCAIIARKSTWTQVTNGIQSDGSTNEFVLPTNSGTGFYRLKVE